MKASIYFPFGFPTKEKSLTIFEEVATSPVQYVEIGIPYSDPSADGEILQYASQVAIENGVKVKDVWEAVDLVKRHGKKAVIMTYANIIYQYGIDEFVEEAKRHALDGIIVPDITVEEFPQKLKLLKPIFLVPPNVKEERLERIVRNSGEFVYIQSRLGITGQKEKFDPRVKWILDEIKEIDKDKNKFIGFGIHSANDVKLFRKLGANGIIVGSALVKAIMEGKGIEETIDNLLDT